MPRTAPQKTTTNSNRTLYLAMELSKAQWKLAFSDGGAKVRTVTVSGGSIPEVLSAIGQARHKFKMPPQTGVMSCYEAGRDGFWIHRELVSAGIQSVVVDPSSIEVDRRARRAKTDRLDARKLVLHLVRHDERGDRMRTVRIPSADEEDARRPERERERLKKEQTAHQARIRSLLSLHGVNALPRADPRSIRTASGAPLPANVVAELQRERARLELVHEQLSSLLRTRAALVKAQPTRVMQIAASLMMLRGIGSNAAVLFSTEFFSWRDFKNGKQVGSCAGLTGTPYDSGGTTREQGISKAGNRRIRAMAVEIAWQWIRYQPASKLTLWYLERFGSAGGRSRRIGIVALARKLLVALWRYVNAGVIPDGALMKA